MIGKKVSAVKLAPPTSRPLTSSSCASIAALSGLTLPPYRILVFLAYVVTKFHSQKISDLRVNFADLLDRRIDSGADCPHWLIGDFDFVYITVSDTPSTQHRAVG